MQGQPSVSSVSVLWRNSLAARFVGLAVVFVFILMSIGAYLNFETQRAANIANLQEQNAMLGNFMTSIAQKPLLSHDYTALKSAIRQIGDSENVVYAAILSPGGTALASYTQRGNGDIANLINEKNEVDIKHIIAVIDQKPDIIHQRYPIISDKKVLGHFVIGISKRGVESLGRDKLFSSLLVSAFFSVLLGVGIYLLLRQLILRPLRQATRGTQRMINGQLDEGVPILSHNELGRFAEGLNQLMLQFSRSQHEKDDVLNRARELNQALEHKVEQQTRELDLVQQKLKKLALHDSLTNLPNRFCIQDNLNRGIADSKLHGSTFTAIIMDLDRFKDINDTLGHECGDQILVEVGRRLQSILRPTDLVGRLGGDEFAILLPDTDEMGAAVVAHKMLSSLEPPFNLADMAFNISASLGIATYPKHGNTTSALLKSADVAMYQAKHNKLGYCIYNPMSDTHTPDRLSLMTELRDAIQNDELMLFYQPKVNRATRTVIGLEALLRWQHGDRGFIPPTEFIPMAEQSGLIRQLTHWVISTALLQLDAWHRVGLRVSMSVNLSMHNLQDPDFPKQLAQMLEQTNVENHFIQFEITESAIMRNPGYVMGVLATLGKMGVSFAIDDFGTGYSSLSTLKRLQVQEIKIDKSFVMDMAMDKDDKAIVHSIIDMAHTLGLSVTAEGVESETIVNQLEEFGCDMFQGHHISRPLPPDRMTQLLRTAYRLPADAKGGESNLIVLADKKTKPD